MRISNLKVFSDGRYQSYLTLDERSNSPNKIVTLLKALGIKDRIFNSDIVGGYLLWYGYPELKPFIDGRQANQAALADYGLIASQPATFWPMAEEMFDFNLILLDVSPLFTKRFLNYILHHPSWELITIEGKTVLFAKRGKFDWPLENRNLKERFAATKVSVEEIEKNLPNISAVSSPIFNQIKNLIKPPLLYCDLADTGISLFDLGYREAGLFYLLEGFKATKDPGIEASLRQALKIYKTPP
jgi:hypothetical protein